MNFKNLRRCGYLLTLLASTVPSVVFGQAALANSTNEFFKPLEPSNPSVNCYCPRPFSPNFTKESKRFIPERYCPDFGGRLQGRIPRDCPLYLKPAINSTSVTQPIMLAYDALERDEKARASENRGSNLSERRNDNPHSPSNIVKSINPVNVGGYAAAGAVRGGGLKGSAIGVGIGVTVEVGNYCTSCHHGKNSQE